MISPHSIFERKDVSERSESVLSENAFFALHYQAMTCGCYRYYKDRSTTEAPSNLIFLNVTHKPKKGKGTCNSPDENRKGKQPTSGGFRGPCSFRDAQQAGAWIDTTLWKAWLTCPATTLCKGELKGYPVGRVQERVGAEYWN